MRSVNSVVVERTRHVVTIARIYAIRIKTVLYVRHLALYVAVTLNARRSAPNLVLRVPRSVVHPAVHINNATCLVPFLATGCHVPCDVRNLFLVVTSVPPSVEKLAHTWRSAKLAARTMSGALWWITLNARPMVKLILIETLASFPLVDISWPKAAWMVISVWMSTIPLTTKV